MTVAAVTALTGPVLAKDEAPTPPTTVKFAPVPQDAVLSYNLIGLNVVDGTNSNVGENGLDIEKGRAAIWVYDIATKDMREFATGLRNPNGLAWNPETGVLWTVVNERDMLGSDIVPDYLTAIELGDHFGWPWYYWGGYPDSRVPVEDANLELQQYSKRPDYALGPHVAALGLTFLCMWLLRHRVNAIWIIFGMFAVGILGRLIIGRR